MLPRDLFLDSVSNMHGGVEENGGTASGTPPLLQAAGDAFQKLYNACLGLAETEDLQAGGKLEVEAVTLPPPPGNLAYTPAPLAGVPGALEHDVTSIVQGFLGVLVSCEQQFADAAVDLYQEAGVFHNADLPPHLVPDTDAGPNKHLPKGITAWKDPSTGQVYFKDPMGTVVTDAGAHPENGPTGNAGTPDAPPGLSDPYETVIGEHFEGQGG